MQTKLAFWNEEHTVSEYYRQAFLYNSELPLLSHLRERMPEVKMLDIGVGTGRTGLYFAPLTSSYVAIDYSAGMVKSCENRLSQLDVQGETKVLEASVLELPFEEGEFDIVLFSFNGIDTLKVEERSEAIKEMQRVCKKGGLVVFSSHNSYYLPHQKKFEFSLHPIRLYHYTKRAIKMAMKNPSAEEALAGDHTLFFDGSFGPYSLCFVKPEFQVAEMESVGLTDVKVYHSGEAKPMTLETAREGKSSWVNYYATKP